MTNRPNILFIFTDQQSAGAMSCAGNGDLNTPAMDRLADGGVRFERAYCTEPLCSPARASMFTGRYPHQVGVPRNNMPIHAALRDVELGNVMSAVGYECVYGGKWHVPKTVMGDDEHGFARICGFNDLKLADACIDFLQRDHERPWFMVASFDNPHNICEYARNQELPWGPIGEPDSIDDCPELPDNFGPVEFEPEVIRWEQQADPQKYPTVSYTADEWRRYRWAYYRLCEKVDAEIGLVLEALDEQGLADDTLVIFSSDHGDGNAAHQWNQKSVLYEETVRVPLIVRTPGGERGGEVDGRLVSTGLDLMPTICDYAGVTPPEGLEGASLRPLLDGESADPLRDELVVETIFDGARGYQTPGRAVVAERYKYVVYGWGRNREQLFDLAEDPGEKVNLAADPARSDVLDDLRDRLRRWCERTGDRLPGGIPARRATVKA